MAGAPEHPPSPRQDLVGGLLAVALGAYAIAEASQYPMGSLLRMGPGFFPCTIAAVIIILGLVLVANALRRRPAGQAVDVRFRSVLAISAGIALFTLLLERAGLIPATAALILVSSLAAPHWRVRRTLLLALGVTALVYLIFILVLQVPVPALKL
jgi:hypothetical protein